MPQYKQGDMWSVLGEVDHFVITTNSVIINELEKSPRAGLIRETRAHLMGLTPDEILKLTTLVLTEKGQQGETLSAPTEVSA